MRRRDFISSVLLGGAAAALPHGARAQQPLPVIGVLHLASADSDARVVASFREGLKERGYVAGRNVTFKFSWAEGRVERLPGLAAELVSQRVTVIVTMGGTDSALAAKGATDTIPIVFVNGPDPVDSGLVTSPARPGGNITGINWIVSGLEAKRLGLLHEVVPDVAEVAVLVNPNFPGAEKQLKDASDAAGKQGVNIHPLKASSERDFETVFATLEQQKVGALLVSPDPYFFRRHKQLVALVGRHAIPTIYDNRDYAAAGGLMSYGTSIAEAARLAGVYAGRILKGEKPGELPVVQPTGFELVVNLKTAKALGLTMPGALLATAAEVYQ